MNRIFALTALLLPSCYEVPGPGTCESIPLPDPVSTDCDDGADLDGDGILDCDDDDIDGDGLRNVWDCSVYDPGQVTLHAGGRCDDPADRADGDLIIASSETRTWEVPTTTLALDANAGSTTLSVVSGADFKEGDEILIFDQQGESAGTYETVMVAGASASSITVEPYILNSYDGADLVTIQRVPHYDSVTINGTLTAQEWQSTGGGVILFRSCHDVDVSGTIDAKGAGYPGGEGVDGFASPFTGDSWNGPGGEAEADNPDWEKDGDDYPQGANNAGGGGAAVTDDVVDLYDQAAGGGGGAHATAGEAGQGNDGEVLALGGEVYGDAELSVWHHGSGGGGGGAENETIDGGPGNISGDGGAGGGIIVIFARESLTVSDVLSAKGDNGTNGQSVKGEVGGGGGGSGGLVMLVGRTMTIDGEISVKGGGGGCPASNGSTETGCTDTTTEEKGGRGGYGYLRLDAEELSTPGTIDASSAGSAEGSYAQWCWESEAIPERPCDTDADGDGVLAWECGGADCDDSDASVFPGAEEIVGDGIDQSCDGEDLCEGTDWLQGGLKPGGCATGGGGLPSAAAVFGLAMALLRRRRS